MSNNQYDLPSAYISGWCCLWLAFRQAFNPFSAGTVSIRQNLTSADVKFWRIKTVPMPKELKYI